MGNDEWLQWSNGWIKEGHFISYDIEGVTYYEYVFHRDLGHWEYDWHETIDSLGSSGPKIIDNFVVTQDYDKVARINYLWQFIFGIKGQVYIYVELPGDTHRHGIPKVPKPSPDWWRVSHFTEEMSPFWEPTFLTEHFMMKAGGLDRITLSAYNPNNIDIRPTLNFFLAMMETQRVGTMREGKLYPTSDRWNDAIDKLYKGTIPCRPLTLRAVRAPAAD